MYVKVVSRLYVIMVCLQDRKSVLKPSGHGDVGRESRPCSLSYGLRLQGHKYSQRIPGLNKTDSYVGDEMSHRRDGSPGVRNLPPRDLPYFHILSRRDRCPSKGGAGRNRKPSSRVEGCRRLTADRDLRR